MLVFRDCISGNNCHVYYMILVLNMFMNMYILLLMLERDSIFSLLLSPLIYRIYMETFQYFLQMHDQNFSASFVLIFLYLTNTRFVIYAFSCIHTYIILIATCPIGAICIFHKGEVEYNVQGIWEHFRLSDTSRYKMQDWSIHFSIIGTNGNALWHWSFWIIRYLLCICYMFVNFLSSSG